MLSSLRTGDADCAITYVPFFDDCLKHDVALSVTQLHKYTVLYEQCANLPDKEVGKMMADLSTLVDNPKYVAVARWGIFCG